VRPLPPSPPDTGTVAGRIPLLAPAPALPGCDGLLPKAFVGEVVPFRVTAFREGHGTIGVHVRLRSPAGDESLHRVLPVGDGLRVDTHVQGGSVVPPFYDSLLAKLIVHGTDRADALARARAALDLLRIDGVTTTVPVHQALLADPEFAAGGVDTQFFERFLTRDLAVAS